MFFEGSEKKVEIVVTAAAADLRRRPRAFWTELVSRCNATILSELHNEQLDAYLLSESSLFVWDDRILMITCGEITLVDSVAFFIDAIGRDRIAMASFQRKNEYQSHLQRTCFDQDMARLNQLLAGKAYRLGHLDGHHNYVWHMDKPFAPPTDDITTELLMYHIEGPAAQYLRSDKQSADGIAELLQLEQLFPGFAFDQHLFEPFGYSMNGIRGDQYITIHITPQEDSSYVSFETDLDIAAECPQLLQQLIAILQPSSFDLITFNTTPRLTPPPNMVCVAWQQQPLACGYQVEFRHWLSQAEHAQAGLQLS
ncbi:adenosylmethionine decarboxylase [uncultured Ferrimonas sp.]|uniref:adenosylmethionine decarboxylase n=1 Tax=uncultured Ferrimonas sp. TaxID=432640 RepID=UPI002604A629|nr:adenosylmethionine decarboxylase [uncultured Ferrimonas sp.]